MRLFIFKSHIFFNIYLKIIFKSFIWYLLLKKLFKSIKFISFSSDLYIFTNKKVIISRLTLAIYINDILIMKKYKEDIVYAK